MKIIQETNSGEAEIVFSDKEIEIISKNKKLILTEEAVRHFGNHLVKIVSDLQFGLSEKVKQIDTKPTTEILTK